MRTLAFASGTRAGRLSGRATVELTPDTDKALLPKFAAGYITPVEMLDQPGSDRVVATLMPVRIVANG